MGSPPIEATPTATTSGSRPPRRATAPATVPASTWRTRNCSSSETIAVSRLLVFACCEEPVHRRVDLDLGGVEHRHAGERRFPDDQRELGSAEDDRVDGVALPHRSDD